MTRQPTNKEDAEAGNVAAIRHVSYSEGYRAAKNLKRHFLQNQVRLKLAQAKRKIETFRQGPTQAQKLEIMYLLGQLQAFEQVYFQTFNEAVEGFNVQQVQDWHYEITHYILP